MTQPTDPPADTSPDVEHPVLGPNPFPSDDPRHDAWIRIARWAAEASAQLEAKLLLTAQTDLPDNFPVFVLDLMTGRFDISARSLVIVSIGNYRSVATYKQVLGRLIESFLSWLDLMKFPTWIQRSELRTELNLRLAQRSAHWMGEAFKLAREAEDSRAGGAAPATEATTTSLQSSELPIPTERRKVERVGGPRLAAWLKDEMARGKCITENRLHVLTELDRKTIKRMLAGRLVAKVRLSKLARGLSIDISDIPTD